LPGVAQLPLEPPCESLIGASHAHLLEPLGKLASELGYTVTFEEIAGATDGWCDAHAKRIVVDSSQAVNGQVRTLVHELVHALGVNYQTHTRPQAELRVNPATVRLWIARRRLPATRPGQRKLLVRRSDVDRMLGHHGSRGQAPVSLNDRIDALERHLHTLYAQRAGTMEPGEDWGWCASCGRNTVFASEGENACRACLAELAGRHP
jgi:excisionase family DNA binding protein